MPSAAVLKAIQLVNGPTAILSSSHGSWLLPIQVGVELGVGLLILTGIYWQQVRWIALLLFLAFAAYSISLAAGGALSCGCFGPIKVHPWWTFLLDAAVVLGLSASIIRSRYGPGTATRWHALDWPNHQTALATILGLSVISTTLLARYASSRMAFAGDLVPAASGLVILEPEKWIGKPLPIADAIDLDLSHGEWIVLLHRHDCPDCQDAVPQYEAFAAGSPGEQIALVEVPPYGNSAESTGSACHYARLRNDRDWFVQTPVEIQLVNGMVTYASTDLPDLTSLTGH